MAFEDVVVPSLAGRLLLMAVVAALGAYGFVFAMQGPLLEADIQRIVLGVLFALRFVASGMTRVAIVVRPRSEAFQRTRARHERRRWPGEVLIVLGGISLVFEFMYPANAVLRQSLFLLAVVLIGLGIDVKAAATGWFKARSRTVG